MSHLVETQSGVRQIKLKNMQSENHKVKHLIPAKKTRYKLKAHKYTHSKDQYNQCSYQKVVRSCKNKINRVIRSDIWLRICRFLDKKKKI